MDKQATMDKTDALEHRDDNDNNGDAIINGANINNSSQY
ncbi:hypothetical protein DERP_003265 [Dermatophagoides pteronyssinus]|uniref:Uncharacterized protein n=1 Tax=Dermatophagoides pteronyssinus TaxID=6956 RepID=A0ABQ8JJ26_DERPT|nr:hypothetical protein DERP_003265 [Dermatophagoides pteronyssinus]